MEAARGTSKGYADCLQEPKQKCLTNQTLECYHAGMKMMQLLGALAVVLLLGAMSPGCDGRPASGGGAAKPGVKRVVTTFTIIQDIAQNVAGDAAIVESITKPGAEIHDYEPTPLDIVKAQSADLVLWNGLGLERWF